MKAPSRTTLWRRKRAGVDASAPLHTRAAKGTAERRCLMCGDTFPSSGIGNRRCPDCSVVAANVGGQWWQRASFC